MTVGIDPGGATTGIVLRDGRECLDYSLVFRADHDGWHGYLHEVAQHVARMRYAPEAVVGMEDLTTPNPHVGIVRVQGMLDVARVDGWLRGILGPDLVIVPPGRNGSMPLGTYPPELVGKREPKGTGILRHARSAWDIAGRTLTVRRLASNPTLFTPTPKDPDR